MSGLNLKEEGIMMRRLTMSILTVIIVAVMSVPLFAFGSTKVGTLSMEQADGSASGGLVTIQLSVESNPGLNRLAVQLIYDSNAMTFAGVSNSGVFSSCDSTPSTGVVNLSFSTGFDTTQSGKIADIVFFLLAPLLWTFFVLLIPAFHLIKDHLHGIDKVIDLHRHGDGDDPASCRAYHIGGTDQQHLKIPGHAFQKLGVMHIRQPAAADEHPPLVLVCLD